MPLVLNEEQRMLQQSARQFLAANAPVAALRALRDQGDALGYSAALWRQMAQLGWAGMILPEAHGGLDFGFIGLGALLEETGRNLTASPLLATSVIGASALLLGGSAAQREALLPAVAAGRLTLALALEESNHHNPTGIALRAEAADDRFVLHGHKQFVMDGHSADQLIVAARSSGKAGDSTGISLFLVAADQPGLSIRRSHMADSRNAANMTFSAVAVARDSLIGTLDRGWQVLAPALDRGRVALAAEMLGSARETFERTVAYLQQREQFGVKIGSFQALQHRAAILYAELELARSVVLQALSAVTDAPEQLPLLASLAKARLNDVAQQVSNEAVQMHGGIGVTDELDIGLFLKRARVTMQLFGDSGFHKNRYAGLSGY